MSELTHEQAMLAIREMATQLKALGIPFSIGTQDAQGHLIAYNHTPPGTRMEIYCAIFDLDVPLWKQKPASSTPRLNGGGVQMG